MYEPVRRVQRVLPAPSFSDPPTAVLGAVIIHAAVFGMIDVAELRRLYRVTRFGFGVAAAAVTACSPAKLTEIHELTNADGVELRPAGVMPQVRAVLHTALDAAERVPPPVDGGPAR